MKHVVAVLLAMLLPFAGAAYAESNSQSSAPAAKTTRAGKTASGAKSAAKSAKSQQAKKAQLAKGLSRDARRVLSRPSGSSRPSMENEAAAVPYTGPPVDHRPVMAVRSPALRTVHPIPPPRRGEKGNDDHERPEPPRPIPPTENGGDEPLRQTLPGASISAPTATGVSFPGIGIGLGNYTPASNPPDVNGRVGATQFVQWNNSSFAIWDKSGTLLYGPAAGNTLFQKLGGVCASHNDGDPIVSYDVMAGRWVLSQFVVDAPAGSASHQCVAVSLTQDATGEYYLYDFLTDGTNFVDYPHVGVWPDGYYMTTHVFNAAGTAQVASRVSVFERAKMLLGQPARLVQADLSKKSNRFQYGFLPADLDSLTPPPAGAAGFVLGPDPAFSNRTDATRVAVTWGTTPTITLTESTISVGIGTAPCVNNTSAQENRDCVPQPSPAVGADYLDNISGHYMYRLAYRNFGGSPVQESLVVAATTAGSASTPAHGAIRWFEFRNAGGLTTAPTSFQGGTFDPDTAYRWLPSAAMDKDHNIAIGYSKSSTSIKPGMYMTGRLGTDTVNTMGAETTVFAGLGVQTTGAGNRWGDYAAMTLDPIDQCTFWFTSEYLPNDGAFNWSTRIASYKFPSCTAAAAWGTVTGNITSCATGVPLSGVVVTLSNGFAGATDASGNYTISVPAGTYTATASNSGRNCNVASPATTDIIISSGGNVAQNFCMSGSSNLQFVSRTFSDAANGNNDGIVNLNECVTLNTVLKNSGCANETGISATLTTTTPGVTITQNASTFPDMIIDATGANATPFKFQTSGSFVCGTDIAFTLNMTYAGGSKTINLTVPTCGSNGPTQTIPVSSLTATDLTQSDRLGRDGVPSTCAGKVGSGGFAGTKYYKTFSFTNPSGSATCYTVTINADLGGAGDIESAAYSPSYNPAALSTNLLGDSGIVGLGTTVGSVSYSFTVPALSTFVIVVNTTGTTTSSNFSGVVSGFPDTTPGPGACPLCTPPATPTITPGGPTTFCAGGNVTLTSSAATGNQWYLNGSAISGATSQQYVATASGSYTVTATANSCTSPQSSATTVTVNSTATPTISAGGATTFCTGGSVLLTSSSATGNQWYLNGNPIGGATSNTYSATATGSYTVVATTNSCPSAASAATSVTVNPIPSTPTISAGGATTFCAGGSVTLTSSSATGNQWYLGGNPIAGATSNTYNATATGSYTVVVTTSGCASAASSATSVTVNPIPSTPTISAGGPTTFCTGGSVTLTSSNATGNQWLLNGSPIAGATSQQYVANASGSYTVTVTTSGCTSAASAATTVTVNPIPSTPTISAGGATTFCAGGSVTLTSSSATGNQWYLGGNPIAGATSNTYNATATGSYTVVVTTSGCASAASSATSVTVNPIPSTPTISAGGATTFCAGGSVTLTSSSATGNQWYLGGNPIAGATSNTYNATATGSYTVVVTTNGCASAASSATSVTVNPIPSTPTISAGGATTFCAGGSVTLTSSSATGNQWYLGSNPIAGATSNTYNATATGSYTVVVTTSGCASAASSATSVTVNPIPSTPTITPGGPTTFCTGGSVTLTSSSATGNQWLLNGNPIAGATSQQYVANATGNYTVTVTTSGCTSAASAATTVTVNAIPSTPTISAGGATTFCTGGSVTLTSSSATGNQWYLDGNPIAGATSNTYNATATGGYTVIVTTSGCSSAASSSTSVTVNPIPSTPTITPGGPTTFCTGGNVTLTSSSATGNQWLLNGSPIAGATSQQYVANASGSYTVTVTTGGCTSAASSATTVTVNATPSTPTITPSGATTFCTGGSVTLTSSSTSGNQWYLDGNPIAGATSNTYNATATGGYTVVVTTSGCSSAASSSTSVTVNPIPSTPTITPGGPTTFCAGGNVTLTSSSATGNQWLLNGSPIAGATSQQYVANASGNYTVTVTTSGCTSAASAATTVTVNATPSTPTITPSGATTFCTGGSVTLTSSSATGNQWYLDGNAIGGATSQQYIANASGNYTVTVTASGCASAASAATSVTVNPIPATPTITPGGPTTFCTGGNVTLTSSSATGNQWLLNGSPIAGATSQQYAANASGSYTVTVTTSGCTSSASSATTVTVNATPSTPTISAGGATTFCTGGNVTLTSSSATGNQWYLDGNAIGGATSQQYVASASGSYTVTVSASGCTSAASAATTVTVNAIPATPTITPGGPTTFCAGGNVTLTSSSATGNQWLLNGNPIAGATSQQYVANASGNYTVTITTSGCTSAASSATTVTVNPIPSTPTISAGGATTFCTGGSVTLTSSSATGNQWFLGGNPIAGATSNTYNATATGSYTVVVTTSGCASAASSATSVTVNPTPSTPTISAGGATTFCTGGSVTLTSSSATGNQWYLDGNAIGGATSNTYNATATGGYTVVVTTSGCSSAASSATSVTVNPIPATPTITPNGATTFCTGGNVTLTSSSASGNQWLLNGSPIAGATSQQYIANASGNYTVTVTTSGCTSAASAATTVTVNAIPSTPTISAGGATTFCAGGSVTLTSSSATGNQWYLDGNPIGGATSNTYNASATGNYTVVVTASGCSSAASSPASVTVNPLPPTPTITPDGPTTFCAPGSVTFTSSSASGNQWYLAGNLVAGQTGQTFTVTSAMIFATGQNFAHVKVTVTASGCSTTSASTLVESLQSPTPSISPDGPTTFCAGGSVTLTSSQEITGQWYRDNTLISGATGFSYIATTSGSYTFVNTFYSSCPSAPSNAIAVTVNAIPSTPTISAGGPTTFCTGGNVTLTSSSATGNQWYLSGNPIAGATSQQYVANAAGSYTVVVTASGCSSAASSATSVTVNAIPSTPTISAGGPTTFCNGGNVTLTSSSASGNQWYLDGSPIGGATSQQYVASAAGSYTVVVTTSGCASAASSATSVTVNPIPSTPTISAGGPTTFCTGGNVTLTSSSATGNQWYLSGNPIAGATSQQYVASAAGSYTVVVTTSGCASAASSATSVTVNPIPSTPTISAGGPTTFCNGGNVTLTSSSASGNQWYLDGNPIGGATSQQYVASAAGSYTVVITTSGCSSAASSATTVTVNAIPSTPTISAGGPTTFCTGGNVTLTSSSASGNQWYLGGNPIAGATSQQYVANAAGSYTVVVTTSGCSSAASSATTVTVNAIPSTPTINAGGPTTFCTGGNVTLTSSSASGNQWYLDGNSIGGATSQQYVASAAGSYTVVVTTSGCSSAASSATTVTVNAIPSTPTISAGGPTTFCNGGSVTLTSSSASGNQWYLGGNPIAGATSNQYVANATGNYTVVVTTSGCASAASAATSVTVNAIPSTPTISAGSATTFCAGGSVTLTSSSATGNQWYLGGNPIAGATSNQYVANASGNYTVVVTTSGCSSSASAATAVTVNPIPATPAISAGGSTTFCEGGSVTLTSSSATGNQWYLGGNPIAGATSNQYVATAAGNYTVIVTTSGCSSAASAATTVTVNVCVTTPSDLNANHMSDITLQNTSTFSIAAWLMEDNTLVEGKVVSNPTSDTKLVATGDLDGDGKADIIVKNTTTGAISMWKMNGTALVSQTVIATPAVAQRVVGTYDFNHDGKMDIVLQNSSTGAVSLWLMNGATLTQGINLGNPGISVKVVGLGKFGGDGILLQDTNTFAVSRWTISGNAVASNLAIGTAASNTNVVAVGDFDGDTNSDIAFQQSGTRTVSVWLVGANGTTITQQAVVATPVFDWKVVGAGDYNGNGRGDLLLQNPATNGIAQWQMNGVIIDRGWNITTIAGWVPLGN